MHSVCYESFTLKHIPQMFNKKFFYLFKALIKYSSILQREFNVHFCVFCSEYMVQISEHRFLKNLAKSLFGPNVDIAASMYKNFLSPIFFWKRFSERHISILLFAIFIFFYLIDWLPRKKGPISWKNQIQGYF